MAKKNNIGLGLAALAVGAGAVAAVTKGHKAEVKKEERKAAVKAAKQDYRNTELGRYDKNSKGIYYSNGNYEAFARPKKPAGVDEKNAYIVGSGLASLAAACFLVRDGQMPGSHIHILEAMDIAGGACDGIFDPARGYVMRGGREMENHFECLWDLFRSIPSIETPGVSILDEYYWLNKHDPNYSLCRATINRGKDAHTDGKFNLSQKGCMEIMKLFFTPDEALYDKRTFTGQLAAQKKHFAEELISYPDAPEEPVSASDLIRQQQEILARNGENQRKRNQLDKLIDEKNQLNFTLRDLDEKIEDLKEEYEQTQAKFTDLEKQIFQARKSAAQLQDESTAELEASIRDIEEINQKVRANLEKSRAEDEAARYASDYDKLTEAITRKRADRMALLNGADLPLPELSVEDGALTYKGKHWRDMSGSDQLRVAAAIVRRLNPDCGFVLLDKLEQMDMTTLQEFSAWLEAEHLQAIATRVSTGSECQIIIEDGMVKDAETTLPPVTEKPQQKSWTKGAF